jgi:uncharacterized protein (UPF0335 family)
MTSTPQELIEQGSTDAAQRLKEDLDAYEHWDREKSDLSEMQRALLERLKADGFDPTAFKKIVALRKKDQKDLEDQAAILAMYAEALGIELKGVIA